MRIAFVYDCIYPYSKGGVEKRLFDMSERLQTKHEVHLFGMKYWDGSSIKTESGIYYHGVCKAGKLYTDSGKRSISLAIRFSVCLFFALIRESEPFDIVDCQNIPYFPAFTCKLYCLLRRKPLIITWYEVWQNYWYEYLGWMGFFGKLIEKAATYLTDYNLAISSKTLNDYRQISRRPITIMPLGIEFHQIQEISPSECQFDILYAGRLIKDKNVDAIIRSISDVNIPDIKCGIIGDGPERDTLELMVKELGLEDRISFLGFVEDAYSYMKSSKIFVFPSKREGFGLVVIEANACGLPVIVLKHPNNAATALIDGNGFVCENENEMSQRITQLLMDEHIRTDMSWNAISSAKRYNWSMLINRYIDFCMKLGNFDHIRL